MGSRDVLHALRGEERAGGGTGGGGGAGDGGGRGGRREHSWRRRRNAAASSVSGPRPAPRRKLTIDSTQFFAQLCFQ